MNELIESIFADFAVPVVFLYYEGHGEPYVTYQQIDANNSLSGDDALIGYADYYDFDVYSKGNYTGIVAELKSLLEANGFVWQPSKSGGDLYEPDTGYYHKSLCFGILREE